MDKRLADLDRLAQAIRQHKDEIIEAVSKDFTGRSPNETLSSEVALSIGAIDYLKKRLKKLAAPIKNTKLTASVPGKTWVRPVPKGVVGIVAPWNYPFQLAIVPAATALAAGNSVLIKPSELTPATSAVMERIVAECFDPAQMAVVQGGVDVGIAFSELPFDHLFFTGSTQVGRLVAMAAAKNLTPVTLELGGKSPCIVLPDTKMGDAATMIAMGKAYNGGQSCTAPDYVLVPKGQERAMADAILSEVGRFYTDLETDKDYTAIISDRHADRLKGMIEEAKAAGATIVEPAFDETKATGRRLAPAIAINPPLDSKIMQEEVFGPLISIIGYDTVDDAITFVNERDHPLALYVFGDDVEAARGVVNRTVSGGAMINGTLIHFAVEHLPFGGIGASGQGAYHGDYGFYEFSHQQAVLEFPKWGWLKNVVTPPYGKLFKMTTDRTIGK